MTASDSQQPFIAVIGCGDWGKHLVRNFHGLGVLHTVSEPSPVVSEYLTDTYGDGIRVGSLSEILANDEVTGVAIASPAVTHAKLVREALDANKDVFVEKPLCLSATEGAELIHLANEKERILMVGHLLWYHDAVLRLREFMHRGDLGRIQYIYANRLNIGKLRREENVLWSFAPHDISIMLGLLGEMPESVQAQGCNILHNCIADTTVSLLSFPSGVCAHIYVSWLHPFKEHRLVVVGDRKMAVLDDTLHWDQKLQLYPHTVVWSGQAPIANKAEVEYVKLDESEPMRQECMHFIECIQSRTRPRTDGEEALRVLKVLNACQQSLQTKTAVNLQTSEKPFYTHESAVIDPGATVGDGTRIWHFSHVMEGARIGQRCNIGQNVMIGANVTVGDDCKVQNNVSIYEGVALEDKVFCGPSAVFTNVINPRAHISRKSEFKGTVVKTGCTIGANATIVCGHTLGRYSFIGAGAVVTKHVRDFALVLGNPARQAGWMCTCGERLHGDLSCDRCGAQFRRTGDDIRPIE